MRKRVLGMMTGVLCSVAGVQAQSVGVGVGRGMAGPLIEQFQQAGTMATPATTRAVTMVYASSNQTVSGRPVSGVEERKSTQTLGDGTEISTSENELFFRDSAGRTRREVPSQHRVVIFDPVARVTLTLNTEAKTVERISMPEPPRPPAVLSDATTAAGRGAMVYTFNVRDGASATTLTAGSPIALPRRTAGGAAENTKHEDLGVESLGGVLATHTKDTLTIPQGQIGNNRDIHVVNERWYSDDLQMLVKTVNSDPRFGENTFELTNVSRDEPNASLFQAPADYAVHEIGRDGLKH
ncbi:MAG: hypothetical protein WDO73_05360 [Ignavibacteriota bacterium]